MRARQGRKRPAENERAASPLVPGTLPLTFIPGPEDILLTLLIKLEGCPGYIPAAPSAHALPTSRSQPRSSATSSGSPVSGPEAPISQTGGQGAPAEQGSFLHFEQSPGQAEIHTRVSPRSQILHAPQPSGRLVKTDRWALPRVSDSKGQ